MSEYKNQDTKYRFSNILKNRGIEGGNKIYIWARAKAQEVSRFGS